MGVTKSPMAFEDCREAFERAMAAERGVKITFPTVREAVAFRARLNTFRMHNRRANEKIYPEGSELHGWSEYDALVASIPRDEQGHMKSEVHIKKRSAEELANIEEL